MSESSEFLSSPPPEIDPSHPRLQTYLAAVEFWQYPPTIEYGIQIMVGILDDTPSMCQVCAWLMQSGHQISDKLWLRCSADKEPNLLATYLRLASKDNADEVRQYAIQQDDDRLLALCFQGKYPPEPASLLAETLKSRRAENCVIWILRNYHERCDLREIALRHGLRYGTIQIWYTIQELFHVQLTYDLVYRMSIDLILACHQDGIVSSQSVVNILCDRLDFARTSAFASGSNPRHFAKLAKHPRRTTRLLLADMRKSIHVIAECPSGAYRLFKTTIKLHELLIPKQIRFLVAALSEETARHIFWGNRNDDMIVWKKQIAKTHDIEIDGMERCMLRRGIPRNLSRVYRDLTQGRDVQYWDYRPIGDYHPMRYIVSKRRLLVPGCLEFTIDSLYLYMRAKPSGSYLRELSSNGVNDSHKSDWLVTITDTERSGEPIQIRLPKIMVPMMQQMLPRNKSARKVVAQ